MSSGILKRLTIVLHCIAVTAGLSSLIYVGAPADSPDGTVVTYILVMLVFFGLVSALFCWEPQQLAGGIVRLVDILWIDLIATIAAGIDLMSPTEEWYWGRIALLIFGPPVTLYALYRSTYWVIRGRW